MGANAVTTVPVYTAGEVLTAADMNITNSGIPVFATTVTRDAAFGGTGEKTLAEGQFAYIEATNTTQYYDGAAWQSVGVTPGIIPIVPSSVVVGSGTATVSANGQVTLSAVGTSVSLNGVFSAAYKNYKILYRLTSTNNCDIKIRLRVAGVDNSASDYLSNKNTVEASVNYPSTGAATTSWNTQATGDLNNTCQIDLFDPFVAGITIGLATANQNSATTNSDFVVSGLLNKATTSYDGMTFLSSAGTQTGTISVYGYNQ